MSIEERVFREVALERLSSPERLDQLVEMTRPRGWVGLLTLILVLAGGLAWGWFGSLPVWAEGSGFFLSGPASEPPRTAVVFLAPTAGPVPPGALAYLEVEGVAPQRHGYLVARVEEVRRGPWSETFHRPWPGEGDPSGHGDVAVVLRLETQAGPGTSPRWTLPPGPSLDPTSGSPVEGRIRVARVRPLDLLGDSVP